MQKTPIDAFSNVRAIAREKELKSKFPIFQAHPHLIYLDSAATTHKPEVVIEAMSLFYRREYATVHRAIYDLSAKATAKVETVRENIAAFVGARSAKEIVFTKGATDAINLVKNCLKEKVSPGDEILITEGEHHANIVPWQMLCKEKGAHLKVAKLLDDGTIDTEHFCSLLSKKTFLVSFAHVFNTTGTINPIDLLCRKARETGAFILVDGAQAPSHMPLCLQKIDADFYTFSMHKLYGPTGIGILYGKKEILEELPPHVGGGDMIVRVSLTGSTFQKPPLRFEAGTPAICEIIGAGAAIDFLQSEGMEKIAAQEKKLFSLLDTEIRKIPSISVLGGKKRIATVHFTSSEMHPMDIGSLLDAKGIAIRTGRHCADPFHERFSLSSSCRASIGIYNTQEDILRFLEALFSLFQNL